MSNETMKAEYSDNDQRLAVCNSQWEGKEKVNRRDRPQDQWNPVPGCVIERGRSMRRSGRSTFLQLEAPVDRWWGRRFLITKRKGEFAPAQTRRRIANRP
jgi:hypothetical protein